MKKRMATVVPLPSQAAWTIGEWCAALRCSKAGYYILKKRDPDLIETVKVGSNTRILTPPAAYLAAKAAEQMISPPPPAPVVSRAAAYRAAQRQAATTAEAERKRRQGPPRGPKKEPGAVARVRQTVSGATRRDEGPPARVAAPPSGE